MTLPAVSVLDRAAEAAVDYLPRFGAALAVLVLGLLAVGLLGRALTRVLIRLGLDRFAETAKVHDVLARGGLERSLSRLTSLALRVALTVAVILAAISLLGLRELDQAINEAVLVLPKLLAALGLVLVGLVLGSLARERTERLAWQMDLRGPLAPAAQWAVLAIFLILALAQIGVPTAILTVLAGIAASGAALTVALAMGLGGRELAREVSAGRYVQVAFQLGQEITVDGQRGRIAAIDTASTLLERDDGEQLRVPHHRFLQAAVLVHPSGAGDEASFPR